MAAVNRFLENFADFGDTPNPDKCENLFDPEEGTVLHPGMTTPLHKARNTGRPGGGEPLDWAPSTASPCAGNRVLRGRAYGVRVPLLARFMPDLTLAEAAALGAPAPGLDVGESD